MASSTRLAFSVPPQFVLGSDGADTLAGSSDPDIIYSKAGDDTLSGGGEVDMFVVRKDEGSDVITDFQAGAGGDVLRLQDLGFTDFQSFQAAAQQSGSDVVVALYGGQTLTLRNVELSQLQAANLELDLPLPASGAPSYWDQTASRGSTLSGTSGNDQLTADVADVTLVGGEGDDTYFVWDHTDRIIEDTGGGIDTVATYGVHGYSLATAANVENLNLMGEDASSALGNGLDNAIAGNQGNNRLDGAAGNDVLTGGEGRDIFVVKQGEGSDVITDFQSGPQGDVVALGGFGFQDFSGVAAALHQVGSDAVLDLGDGSVLTFRNSDASLGKENFSLGVDKGGLVQTFFDGFDSFDRFSDGGGTWRTRFEYWGDGAFTLAQNGEQQIYVDTDFRGLTGLEEDEPLGYNPFSLENGQLVITAKPIEEPTPATRHFDFTSGMISTQSSFWQTYGYFEITAELPTGQGAWPAFWMLPVDNRWPPELDILEAVGNQPDQVHSALIGSGGTTDAWVQVDTSDGPHSFGMLWTPYEISFYVDGVKTMSAPTGTEMHDAMYMIANLAIGGEMPGIADPSLIAQFKIDSIEAYQLPEYTLEQYTLLASGKHTRYIEGTYGDETLRGTSGNDFLNGRSGADTLIGAAGDDTYNANHSYVKVVEQLGGGVDTIRASVSYTLPDHVENLHLVGNNGWNGARGNDLPNIIVGNGGGNVITGERGNDVLTGGAGPDTFVFQRGDGSDIITDFGAGPGRGDVVKLEDYGFSTFAEVHAAMKQVGDDTHIALSSFETLVLRDTQVADFAADDFLLPSIPPESQAWIRANIGTEGADEMLGSASNERFEGKGNADLYAGGLGDDTYLIDNAEQQIREGMREGIDTVEAFISYALPGNVENLTLLNSGAGTGNDLANRVLGSGGDDVLNGLGGNDYLVGGAGDDIFVFEAGNGSNVVADFRADAGEQDSLRFVGYGDDAYLTNVGDEWTIHYSGGTESFHLAGITSLSETDYVFA